MIIVFFIPESNFILSFINLELNSNIKAESVYGMAFVEP